MTPRDLLRVPTAGPTSPDGAFSFRNRKASSWGDKAKPPISHPAALLFHPIRRAYAFLTSLLLASVATRNEYP
jgi:hypothetical protein